jgi:hypothetical protein
VAVVVPQTPIVPAQAFWHADFRAQAASVSLGAVSVSATDRRSYDFSALLAFAASLAALIVGLGIFGGGFTNAAGIPPL